jgi:hypothetical protein
MANDFVSEDQEEIAKKEKRSRTELVYRLLMAILTISVPIMLYIWRVFAELPAPGLICIALAATFFPISFLPITGLSRPSPTSAKRLNDLIKRIVQFKAGVDGTSKDHGGLQADRFYFSNDSVKYLLACVDKFCGRSSRNSVN